MLLLFFFNDTATTEIYTLSLHDALPILACARMGRSTPERTHPASRRADRARATARTTGLLMNTLDALDAASLRDDIPEDRKSTRLNSSHANISYAVFCLKKKKITAVSTV